MPLPRVNGMKVFFPATPLGVAGKNTFIPLELVSAFVEVGTQDKGLGSIHTAAPVPSDRLNRLNSHSSISLNTR